MTDATVRGHLELLALSALAASPGHGYALLSRLGDLCGDSFELTEGALYPVLHKLEDAGFVQSRWDESGSRRRRVYEITAEGRRELSDRVTRWQMVRDAVDSVIDAASAAAKRSLPRTPAPPSSAAPNSLANPAWERP